MKIKNFNKKLNLRKNTIAHLGNEELQQVYGGISAQPCLEQSIICIYTYSKCATECGPGGAAC
jgi:hypothetical protein